jgi:hypothetical protein
MVNCVQHVEDSRWKLEIQPRSSRFIIMNRVFGAWGECSRWMGRRHGTRNQDRTSGNCRPGTVSDAEDALKTERDTELARKFAGLALDGLDRQLRRK